MPHFGLLPIMPKQIKAPMSHTAAAAVAPYPQGSGTIQRNAAIWSTADDEILLRARASGLNWQPIASKHFPNKSANACRKRHERLIERRQTDDWDNHKLELLAQEYMACRKEMWEVLASRLGEKWNVVEAKCMEKGIKNLQSTARTAQRKASISHDQGISDHNSDSGIVLSSGSEAEMDVDEGGQKIKHGASISWSETCGRSQQLHQDHIRSRSLPVPQQLPLYRPPMRLANSMESQAANDATVPVSPGTMSFEGPNFSERRYSPGAQQRGISIQSVLAPATEPQHAEAQYEKTTHPAYIAQ